MKFTQLLMGAGTILAFSLLLLADTESNASIDYNNNFKSSHSSISISQNGKSEYSASTSLTTGGRTSFVFGNDSITLSIDNVDLSPLAYDGSGTAVLDISLNKKKNKYTFSIPARFNPNSSEYMDSVKVGDYELLLVGCTGNFDNPILSFEIVAP